MPANLTNLTETGIDLADKYLANTDIGLIESYLNDSGLAIFNLGSLWVAGRNIYGELGTNDRSNRNSPTQIGTATNWKQAVAGQYHLLFLNDSGALWASGANVNGQLGLGDVTPRSSPVQVGSLTNWSQISPGAKQSFAIKTDGTLWAWGRNDSNYGSLGLGDRTHRSSPTQVGSLTDWSRVAGGRFATGAIKTNGTLWTWGANFAGQLGSGTTTSRSSPVQVGSLTNWKQISTDSYGDHFLAVKTDGTLWAWGVNNVGQLGLGDRTNRSSPTQVGTLTNWKSVDAGSTHSIALKTDGTIWVWGGNAYYGGLGLGDLVHRSSPVQVGALTNWKQVTAGKYSCAGLKTDGTWWSWGRAIFGQLGTSGFTNVSSPVQVGALTKWRIVDMNHAATTAIFD